MKHYTARVRRSDGWWAITVDGVRGAHSQTRRLDRVEANAREVIALITEESPDSFTIDVVQEMPEEMEAALAAFFEESHRAADAQARFSSRQRATVQTLLHDGLTVRDVGSLMGLSHQRVAQIAKEATKVA